MTEEHDHSHSSYVTRPLNDAFWTFSMEISPLLSLQLNYSLWDCMAHFNYYSKRSIPKVLDCRFMDVATLGQVSQTLACISRYTPHFAHPLFNLLRKGLVKIPLIVSSFFAIWTILWRASTDHSLGKDHFRPSTYRPWHEQLPTVSSQAILHSSIVLNFPHIYPGKVSLKTSGILCSWCILWTPCKENCC